MKKVDTAQKGKIKVPKMFFNLKCNKRGAVNAVTS